MVQYTFFTLGYDLNEICTLHSSMQNIQTSFVRIPKFMIKWLFVYWFYDALGEANNQTVFLMSLNLTEDNDDLKSIKKFEQEKPSLLVSRQAYKIYDDMIVACTISFRKQIVLSIYHYSFNTKQLDIYILTSICI